MSDASTSDASEIERLKKQIAELREQNAALNDGTQVSRADYEALYQRLRNQQDDHIEVIRAYRDLEKKLEESLNEKDELQTTLQTLRKQQKANARSDETRNQELHQLKLGYNQMESLSVKHRQDVLSYLADNKQLNDSNKRLQSHIQDVDGALVQMLERNKELDASLRQYTFENQQLLYQIEQQKREIRKLKLQIDKRSDDARRDQRIYDVSRHGAAQQDYANAQQKLIIAENTIAELRARIAKLENEEQKAAKLQIELAKQKQVNEILEEQNEQLENEIQSHRSSVEECRKQIELLKDHNEDLKNDFEEKKEALSSAVEYYRKRTENEFKLNTELEESIIMKDQEIKDLKTQIADRDSQVYGLPEAVIEVRQLKAMVSVRDAQIADMITDNQWYERVIAALSDRLGSEFDLEAFFIELQKKQKDDDERMAKNQALLLLKQTLAENKGSHIGEIRIILGSKTSTHKKHFFVSTGANGEVVFTNGSREDAEFSQNLKIHQTLSVSSINLDSDQDSELDPNAIYEKKKMDLYMKQKKKEEKEKKLKAEIRAETMKEIPHVIDSVKIEVKDRETQPPEEITEKEEPKESTEDTTKEDRWVRDLRAKIQKLEQDKKKLNEQLEDSKAEFNRQSNESESQKKEINALKARIDELLAQIDKLKTELKESNEQQEQLKKYKDLYRKRRQDYSDSESYLSSEDGRSSPRRSKSKSRTKRDLSDELVEKKPVDKPKLKTELSMIYTAETRYHFTYTYIEESVTQFPTQRELEVTDARIRALQEDLADSQRQAASAAAQIDEMESRIKQKDDLIQQLKKTIDDLKIKFDEQREAFNEKIVELNKDAERVLERRLKEAQDVNDLSKNPLTSGMSEADLESVKMRLAKLNQDNQRLKDLLREMREELRLVVQENQELQRDKELLEQERSRIDNDDKKVTQKKSLSEDNSKLRRKIDSLQSQIANLESERDAMKSRAEKLDRDNRELNLKLEGNNGLNSTGESGDQSSKIRGIQRKVDQLKAQNEEMQSKLAKAQTTIERLNQLLQRKEQQLTKSQEQVAQYKNQLARYQLSKK